jgi:hypothetical protein
MGGSINRLGIEWVVISKRSLYAGATLLFLSAALGAGLYLRLARNSAGEAEPRPSAVRFSLVEGEVRVVRHETREVVRAGADTSVRPGDLVETLEAGKAVITMADGSLMEISPNSVVTIAENAGAREGSAARVRIAVQHGRVEISTDEQPAEASNAVETRLTKNLLTARTEASFDVLEDRSEEVRVGTGSVVSETPAGRTTIGPDEHIALGSTGEVRWREPLLDAPVLYAPPHGARVVARRAAERSVPLEWTRSVARAAITYRIEIASSPFFVRAGILFERDGLIGTRLVVTDLAPGNYYWRARAVSETGQASAWGGPQKFIVIEESDDRRSP